MGSLGRTANPPGRFTTGWWSRSIPCPQCREPDMVMSRFWRGDKDHSLREVFQCALCLHAWWIDEQDA